MYGEGMQTVLVWVGKARGFRLGFRLGRATGRQENSVQDFVAVGSLCGQTVPVHVKGECDVRCYLGYCGW